LGLIVGVATVKATVTVKVNAVVLVTLAPVAVMVTGKLPAGVEPVVFILSTGEQLGLQEADEKKAVVSLGNPETDNETGWLVPDVRAALIVLVTALPASTDLLPVLLSVKSKLGATVPVTVSVKLVLRVTPAPVAVTLMG
jgi:hypothetical protein